MRPDHALASSRAGADRGAPRPVRRLMRWHVRDVTAADAAAVVALVLRFTAEDGNPPGRLTVEDFLSLSFGAEVRFRTKVADGDGAILGYALFYPSYDTDHGAKGAYLQDLYVLPEA